MKLGYGQRTLLVSTLILAVCYGSPRLLAQATAIAQISGVVADATGGRIAGAQVKATQANTGFIRTATTSAEGTYNLPNLPVGPYSLEAAAPGFKGFIQRGIVLQVNDNVARVITLELGDVVETVEVSADASMVQTQSTGVSQVIERARVEDLPLNGRDATQLILLSGAAIMAPPSDLKSSKNYPTSQAISVAGGQANSTYYLLDGGDHNDPFGNINMPLPFPDALQEFSVQTSAISAQYGGHAGAVVNAVTKSGTNELHGNLFHFLRNGSATARNFFAAEKDTLKRNQFGGTIGGPVRRDKLFFFAGYQGSRIRSAPPTSTSFVPTPAVLSGDFSTIASANCGPARTITDPATGQPFAGNFINPARFDASALKLLKFVPVSNDPCGRIQVAVPNPLDEDQIVGRVDWYKSEKHSIFGRYSLADLNNPAVFNGSLLLANRFGVVDRAQSVILGYDYTVTPTVLNSLRISLGHNKINRRPADGVPSAAELGMNIAPSDGNTPFITISNYFSTSCGTCSLARVQSGYGQVANDVSWSRGRQQITFGVNLIFRQSNYNFTTGQAGRYLYNGQITGLALADLMLGRPFEFVQGNFVPWWGEETIFGLYVNDSIRVSPRLNVTVGLRWQPYFAATDKVSRATYFDRAGFRQGLKSSVFDNAPAGVLFPGDRTSDGEEVPTAGFYGQKRNFEPRVGIAWDPTGTGLWSIRSSYGVFYELPAMQRHDRFGIGPPWGSTITIRTPAGGTSQPYLNYPGGNPFPIPAPPPKDVFFPLGAQYVTFGLHTKPPYTQHWNLSVQRQLGQDWLLSANYLGNKTTHRWLNAPLNPAVYIPGASTVGNTEARRVLTLEDPVNGPLITTITANDDGGNVSYNALYLTANHRFSQNFSILANYTWSHCIGDGWTFSEIAGLSYQNPYNRADDRSNCVTDIRQLFNLSFLTSTPRFSGPVTGALFSNWRFGGIVSKRTGFWISPVTGVDASLTGVGADRPNLTGNPYPSSQTVEKWLEPSAFARNAPGTYGNAGRYSLEGPGGLSFDAMMVREFRFRESQRFEVRVEAFNVLNHPVFDNPVSNFNSANFGRILSAQDPRIWQFGLKYFF